MTKWLSFFAIMFLVCSIMSGITEAQYLEDGEGSTIRSLMFWEEISFNDPISFMFSIPVATWNLIEALWVLFSWDYSFFTGELVVFRYLGWCLTLGLVVSIWMSITRRGSVS